ncbi:MAG: exodeoxyribonuclease III [Alphaproteobacteria bacterium]|nr:exodeoxyribonuclease III [Alphaproteobacteria bacterium]
MPTIKIATWNINSVRLRAPIIKRVMKEMSPDILCLQETKCPDDVFPFDAFKDTGYDHIHIHGMKSYNGQAIFSKIPFLSTDIHHRVGREDCRHIAASFKEFDLHNLYIPAGGDEPDPAINDKYAHKLDFVDEMSAWFPKNYKSNKPIVTLGDFNIAPQEHDVWSHKQLRNVVSHTEPEITRLNKMLESLKWTDAVRHFVPSEEKCYTWWSYRNRDWKKSNRGRRLDHIWVTEPLAKKLKQHEILTSARDWEKPSDHVPVMIELKL